MYKKEFFGLLLLVSMISTVMFAGFVWAPSGPSLSVYPSTGITFGSDVYIYVTGAGWASGVPVTVYWDQIDANHTIAIVTPGSSGSFRLDNLEIETTSIGMHNITAVQGLSMATAHYTVTVTLPPDERLLTPIQQIENKLDNTISGLLGIQSNFTTVLNNLTTIDNDINAIEGKLDPSGRLGNTTQMESKRGDFNSFFADKSSGLIVDCSMTNGIYLGDPAQFSLSFYATSSDPNVQLMLWSYVGSSYVLVDFENATFTSTMKTFTYSAESMRLEFRFDPVEVLHVSWALTVQAPAGANITWTP